MGVRRALDGRQGPISRPHTPYAKFLRLLATFHMRQIFPETAGARPVRHMPLSARESLYREACFQAHIATFITSRETILTEPFLTSKFNYVIIKKNTLGPDRYAIKNFSFSPLLF